MKEYEERMSQYCGADMEMKTEPVLSDGEKECVIITHDETTLYANEGRSIIWMENNNDLLNRSLKVHQS